MLGEFDVNFDKSEKNNFFNIVAGLYSIVLILFIVLTFALFFFEILPFKHRNMLLVVNLANIDVASDVENKLKKLKIKYSAKSKKYIKRKS